MPPPPHEQRILNPPSPVYEPPTTLVGKPCGPPPTGGCGRKWSGLTTAGDPACGFTSTRGWLRARAERSEARESPQDAALLGGRECPTAGHEDDILESDVSRAHPI